MPARGLELSAPSTRHRPWFVSAGPLAALLILPLAGLVALLAQPSLDVAWEHHPAHFWLVLVAAGLNAMLA